MIKSTVWPLEPHTRAKHAILKRYLEAWLPIMGKYNRRIVFIDGFAGPGVYAGGEEGSPIIALNTATRHTNPLWKEAIMVFIESDPERFARLETVLANYPPLPDNVRMFPFQGRFNEHMTELLRAIEGGQSRLAPTFAFIDPFGFSHTPMSVIKRIMRNEKCEVLINFMYEEVNRFIEHPNPTINAHYDGLFGTDEWRTVNLGNSEERKQSIMDLYIRQLRDVAEIKYVWPFEMAGRDNRTDYFLVFGSNSLEGLKKMKEAMWKVDTVGGSFFSDKDAYDAQQPLFAAAPDFALLRRMITERFRGETCTIEDVERFVLEETPFRETHIKGPVLVPMEKEGLVRVTSPRKKKHTYPERTQLQFAASGSLFD